MSSKKDQDEEVDAEIMEAAGLSPDQALIFICVHMSEMRRRQGKHSKENEDRHTALMEKIEAQGVARKVIDDATSIIIGNLKERVLVLETEKKSNVRWMIAICSVSTALSGIIAVILPWALR